MKKSSVVRYPWEKWFGKIRDGDGKLVLKRGTHYNCMTHSMYIQVRAAAKSRGIRISCMVKGQGESLEVRRVNANRKK